MPSYQKKKEKCEQKSDKADKPTRSNKSDTLVDPSLVSVIGVATSDKKAVKSPERVGTKKGRRKSTEHLPRSPQLIN